MCISYIKKIRKETAILSPLRCFVCCFYRNSEKASAVLAMPVEALSQHEKSKVNL